jgi:hypothetical protein
LTPWENKKTEQEESKNGKIVPLKKWFSMKQQVAGYASPLKAKLKLFKRN